MSPSKNVAGYYYIENLDTDLIGQGAMGEVYRSLHVQTGQTVAVKVLKPELVRDNPELVERFVREGEALRELNHPNIVQRLAATSELDDQTGTTAYYLVMEYVSGGSLREFLEKEGQLPVKRVLQIALELSDALSRAHHLNIIHRDLKPGNVLLANDGTPRLTDFGIAHVASSPRLTQTGIMMGTIAYLSPEACEGSNLDERTDIWAFGVMLYEMLNGELPFKGGTLTTTLTSILTDPLPDILAQRPDVPPALAALIERMLAKDVEQRMPSMRLIGAEIEAILKERPLTPKTPVPSQTPLIESTLATSPTSSTLKVQPPQPTASLKPGFGKRKNVALVLIGLVVIGFLALVFVVYSEFSHRSQENLANIAATTTADWSTTDAGIVLAIAVETEQAEATGARATADALATAAQATANTLLVVTDPAEATPTQIPTNTPEPEPTAPQVAHGKYGILVAQLEPLTNEERDVTRIIVDDLRQNLEIGNPFVELKVEEYPEVIRTADEAAAAAEQYQTAVVIWGNFDDERIQLEIQLGYAPNLILDRSVVEDIVNVRVNLTEEQQESAAYRVITVLTGLETGTGDSLGVARLTAISEDLNVRQATIVSEGVAYHYHQSAELYFDAPAQAMQEIDAALALSDNPILFSARSLYHINLGNFDAAKEDLQSAIRLAPDGWAVGHNNLIMIALLIQNDLSTALEGANFVVLLRPNDWFSYFQRGLVHYLAGDYELARTDLNQAMLSEPSVNWAHLVANQVALRQGRLVEAALLSREIILEYPDLAFSERVLQAVYGDSFVLRSLLSAGGNLLLGQYKQALLEAETSLVTFPNLSDLYYIQGLANCNLGDYEAADLAYSNGIEVDPKFILLYLLRAEVRLKTQDLEGALSDVIFVQNSNLALSFAPVIAAAQEGALSCGNLGE
jgi:serine/threonine protein kinase/tetratricopeptide (TPR) repeat protein